MKAFSLYDCSVFPILLFIFHAMCRISDKKGNPSFGPFLVIIGFMDQQALNLEIAWKQLF